MWRHIDNVAVHVPDQLGEGALGGGFLEHLDGELLLQGDALLAGELLQLPFLLGLLEQLLPAGAEEHLREGLLVAPRAEEHVAPIDDLVVGELLREDVAGVHPAEAFLLATAVINGAPAVAANRESRRLRERLGDFFEDEVAAYAQATGAERHANPIRSNLAPERVRRGG
jgi:hypothetical protein